MRVEIRINKEEARYGLERYLLNYGEIERKRESYVLDTNEDMYKLIDSLNIFGKQTNSRIEMEIEEGILPKAKKELDNLTAIIPLEYLLI